MAKKRPRADTCVFREGGRRCAFPGAGQPPLCGPHRMALAAAAQPRSRSSIEILTETVVDFMQGRPINKEATLGAVENFFQQWSGTMGADYRPDVVGGASEDGVHRRAQSGNRAPIDWGGIFAGQRTQPRPAPGPDPNLEQARQVAAAKRILGFAESSKPNELEIKIAFRRLVRKNHPDHGGSVAKMAAINNARDVLLAAL